MANIKNYIENIRSAIFGKEVRGSLADGLDAINKETENTTFRQKHLEKTFDQLIINEGNSNAEIVDARVGENGSNFNKLGDRLDSFDSHLTEIEHEKATKQELNVERTRIDNLASLPEGTGVGEAELIDGRISSTGAKLANIGGHIRAIEKGLSLSRESVTPDMTTFLNYSKNLFDKTKIRIGSINSNGIYDGSVTSNFITDYIYLKERQLGYSFPQFEKVHIYGENKKFLRTVTLSANNTVFANDVIEVIFEGKIASSNNYNLMINYGLVKPYEEYGISKLKDSFVPNNVYDQQILRVSSVSVGNAVSVPRVEEKTGSITFYANTNFYFRNESYQIVKDKTISFAQNVLAFAVVINYITKEITSKPLYNLSKDDYIIFRFSTTNGVNWNIKGECSFILNGISNERDDRLDIYRKSNLEIIPFETMFDYLPQGNSFNEFNYDTPYSDFLLKFDELINSSNGFLTKTILGKDESGTYDIFKISTNPKIYYKGMFGRFRPKLLINCGLHGFEKASVYALYYLLKDVIEHWNKNKILEYLRWNVTLEIIPVLNPWGFDNKTYWTSNHININRSFPTGFKVHSLEDKPYDYAGLEPLACNESKILKKFIDDNLDAVFLVDFHTMGKEVRTGTEATFSYHNVTKRYNRVNQIGYNASRWHLEYVNRHYPIDYNLSTDPAQNYGYIVSDDNNGQCYAYAMSQGLMGQVVEVGCNLPSKESQSDFYSEELIKVSTRTIGQWLNILLKMIEKANN